MDLSRKSDGLQTASFGRLPRAGCRRTSAIDCGTSVENDGRSAPKWDPVLGNADFLDKRTHFDCGLSSDWRR